MSIAFDKGVNIRMKISFQDLIYIAGFFDGEGCVHGIIKGDGRPSIPRISIGQKRPEVLFWIKEVLNMGTIHKTSKGSSVWRINNKKDVERFISLILPYSKVKREELIVGRRLNDLIRPRGGHTPITLDNQQKRLTFYNQLKKLKGGTT